MTANSTKYFQLEYFCLHCCRHFDPFELRIESCLSISFAHEQTQLSGPFFLLPPFCRANPLGSGGALAEEFFIICRAIWFENYRHISPRDFKVTTTNDLLLRDNAWLPLTVIAVVMVARTYCDMVALSAALFQYFRVFFSEYIEPQKFEQAKFAFLQT